MEAVVTAVAWVAAGLLGAAGVGKLAVPDGAMAALHDLGLPSGRVAARVVGLGELAAGVAVVALAGLVGATVLAVAYAGLLAVALRARSRQVDCGCFGAPTGQVTVAHLAVDAAAALAGVAGLIWPPVPLGAALPGGPFVVVAAAVLTVCAVTAVRLLLTALPDLRAALR